LTKGDANFVRKPVILDFLHTFCPCWHSGVGIHRCTCAFSVSVSCASCATVCLPWHRETLARMQRARRKTARTNEENYPVCDILHIVARIRRSKGAPRQVLAPCQPLHGVCNQPCKQGVVPNPSSSLSGFPQWL
jgi:hypothetical protein